MTFKKLFLPVGLIIAILFALLLPAPGTWMKDNGLVPFFVVAIFLMNGWYLNLKEAKLSKQFFHTFAAACIISLFIGPLIGIAIAKSFGLSNEMELGLIVMSSVPVTLSSAIVVTEVGGGNALWALFMTVGMNIAGIFTVPFMLKFGLEEAEGIDISATKLLLKLLLLVLLPFLVGFFLKKLIKKELPASCKYIPSTCVILTVLAGFSASCSHFSQMSLRDLPLVAGAALSVHLLLLIIAAGTGFILKLDSPARIALSFVASQKTLPIAISVLAIVASDAGLVLIPSLVFHFIQLLMDSFIAAHLDKKSPEPAPAT